MPHETNKNTLAATRSIDTPPDGAGRTRPGRAPAPFGDRMAFLRGFLMRPREVASVVPSSRFLEGRVVRAAEVAAARCVVELGPGTGGTTRALLRALGPRARLLAIELNPDFCARLRQRVGDPRLLLQAGSAESLADYLARHGLPAPDAVISGIPFSTMPQEVAQRIAAAVDASLAPGGRFVAYQLRPHVADYVAPHLGAPRQVWEWRNLPPMRVFRWVKGVGDNAG